MSLLSSMVSFQKLNKVSSTYNDPGERMGFINGTGSVDLYGVVSDL